MWKIVKTELKQFAEKLKELDSKTVSIFLSSTILFTISWYFANPKFSNEVFSFHHSYKLVIEDLVSFAYWFFIDSILFLVIPFLLIKFVFHQSISDYGIRLGEKNIGFAFVLVGVLIFIPIIYFISITDNFDKYFPLMQSATDELNVFVIYELLFILFVFSWEFIFRGFILFGLEKRFGLYAIFIQMIPFVLLHIGKPFIEMFAAIFGALYLGWLALRTRSILYGFLIHVFILLSLDIIAYVKS